MRTANAGVICYVSCPGFRMSCLRVVSLGHQNNEASYGLRFNGIGHCSS
jgi:hypothetical protein